MFIIFVSNVLTYISHSYLMMYGDICIMNYMLQNVNVEHEKNYKTYLQNLKYNIKGAVFFIWFWFIFYPVWYCPLRTGGCFFSFSFFFFFLLSRENLLSVIKVICWQSLNRNLHNTVRSLLYYENIYKLKEDLIKKIFSSGSK